MRIDGESRCQLLTPGSRRARSAAVAFLLAAHVALVAWLGAKQSPTVDETAHLAAGMAMWQYGSFDVYCVNPPLMRAVATLPILGMPHELLWGDFAGAPQPRPEFLLGRQFVESHPEHWRRFLIAARWAILPFTVLGGLFCYLWARELFGWQSGLLALCLWCFSPNILTWSSLISTDGTAAAMGIAAGYFFWRWLREPTWSRTAFAGTMLGWAVVAKMTWLLLFVLWPALWLIWTRVARRREQTRPPAARLAALVLLGLCVVNLGYGLADSFARLESFEFHSQLFSGREPSSTGGPAGNRFRESVLGALPVPLPKDFLRGIDLQRLDFEAGMPSYLFGEWSDRGWWYYYLVGLALKVPLGTWMLGLLAAMMFASGCWRRAPCEPEVPPEPGRRTGGIADQVVVAAPALAVLALVSSQDGFSGHFRYALPAFPFAFVWISQVAKPLGRKRIGFSAIVVGALAWSVASSLSVYPHTMAHFNAVAGGPANGYRHMLGRSLSWAQDCIYLKDWLDAHPEVESPYMAVGQHVSLERLGIRSRGAPPQGPVHRQDGNAKATQTYGPVPGWHVICVQHIYARDGSYRYFEHFEPVATMAHSTRIYHIDLDEANRVRRRMRLPPISHDNSLPETFISGLAAARTRRKTLKVALFRATALDESTTARIGEVIGNGSDLSVTDVSEYDIREGRLPHYDVVLVPGGKASVQGSALGSEGRRAIQEFVRDGGGYIGVCAGAHLACVNYDWSLKLVNARCMSGERFVPGHGTVSASLRPWGPVIVELTDDGGEVFGTRPERFDLNYTGGPIFFRANDPALPDYRPIASFRSELWSHPYQKGTMIDSPAALVSRYGQGTVILFSPHPESVAESERLLIDAIRASAARSDGR